MFKCSIEWVCCRYLIVFVSKVLVYVFEWHTVRSNVSFDATIVGVAENNVGSPGRRDVAASDGSSGSYSEPHHLDQLINENRCCSVFGDPSDTVTCRFRRSRAGTGSEDTKISIRKKSKVKIMLLKYVWYKNLKQCTFYTCVLNIIFIINYPKHKPFQTNHTQGWCAIQSIKK